MSLLSKIFAPQNGYKVGFACFSIIMGYGIYGSYQIGQGISNAADRMRTKGGTAIELEKD